jgi:glycosyltransferase involved in cell wall biosynthesis
VSARLLESPRRSTLDLGTAAVYIWVPANQFADRLTTIAPVLHLLAPARHGGLESVVAMLASGQGSDATHIVPVLVPEDSSDHPFVLRLRQLGITVTPVVVGARSYVEEYRALNEILRKLAPRIVHTHGYHADAIGGLVARASRIPTVSTVHGFVGGSRRNRFNERIQLLALRRADAILAVSRPLVDRLVRAGVSPRKVHFVPNGFSVTSAAHTTDDARKLLGLRTGSPIAGWIGRLSAEKGPDVALDAIALSEPPWRLSVIGDGKERRALEMRAARLGIADRVVWHGARADAGSLITAFDAFVLSSRTEGTPIALFEAMNGGVPVIATRVGGVPDVVSPLEAIVVEPEAPTQIAAALRSVIEDSSAAADRAERARKKVREVFGLRSWVQAVERVYSVAESGRVITSHLSAEATS